MAMLIGMSADIKGEIFEFNESRVSIGRNSNNIITIEHPTISGSHARITKEGKQYTLKDLKSTNGTRVNGQEVEEAHLKPKDLVQLGNLEFMFDANDAVVPKEEVSTGTRVEESSGPATAPTAFDNISPFGTRKSKKTLWIVLISVVGTLAVAAVLFLLYRLFLCS